jgi:cell wall-associated NlpC family hydrolase
MWVSRVCAALLMVCVLTSRDSTAQSRHKKDATGRTTASVRRQSALIGPEDGLSVLGAALDTHRHTARKLDCSHLVHTIYERAGFSYDYVNSSDLYQGTNDFQRVKHPRPGDLVVWPGHVGIVVNPAQHSFYSALGSGSGVDSYDSTYWQERGRARFFRYLLR